MNKLIISVALCLLSIGSIKAQGTIQTLVLNYYNDCQGPEAANYTLLSEASADSTCSRGVGTETNQLVSCSGSNRTVIGVQRLASVEFPAGAYTQREGLWLATSGALEGRYIYERVIHLAFAYTRYCSSILGYSYVTSKSAVLLISSRLDLNMFVAPNGAYGVFRSSASTICNGISYVI